VANRLDRLATLTYVGIHNDPKQVSADIGAFFRELRDLLGAPFPYLWVREWHPGGHGLHVHFLVGKFIHWSLIKEAWGDGRIDIRRKSRPQLRLGDGPAEEARYLARYLAKYLSKGSNQNRDEWSHRFDVAQGFQPRPILYSAPNEYEARLLACRKMGSAPSALWQSRNQENYTGPEVSWMAWNR